MSRANASEGWSSGEKGLPALPSVLDALAAHTQSLRMAPPWDDHAQAPTPTGSVKSRKSTKGKRRMKDLEKQMDNNRSFTPILTDIHTPPYSSRGSPATPTPARSPFTPASLDSTGSGTPHRGRFDFGGPPDSPSVASHHSMSASTKTKKSLFGTGTKGSSSAPSVRSSHTMPDMVAYNDVDQWGAARAPPSPRKALDTSAAASGVRRKNSSSKLLVNGLSRSLTRMGSVMKRSTSANDVNTSGGAGRRKDWLARRRPTQSATVAEEADMGEGWERVDMNREVTEGDTSITRPFNVEHDLHVSPDLGDLPPAWLEALKAQGLSEADLMLISAARHKAAQRPMLRIVKGSTPPPNEMPTSSSTAHAHTRGMSTPAHLVNLDHGSDIPLLNKRFSWERGTSTPTHSSTSPTQLSPFREYRQSLQDPLSPPSPQTPPRSAEPDSPNHETPRQLRDTHSPIEARQHHEEEETPRKTKRWSDQLKGFQNSFSSLGGDDDWASKLTLALVGNAGLQTVDEVDSIRGQSMDSARTFSAVADAEPEPKPQTDCAAIAPIADPAAEPSMTPRSSRKNPKSLSIYAPAARHATEPASSPSPRSPRSPGGTRIRRKPVPGQHERRCSSSRRSVDSPALDKPWPRSPPPPPRKDKPTSPTTATPAHPQPQSPTTVESFPISSESFGVHSSPSQRSPSDGAAQSNESEQEPDVRTPSTNRHFFHSPSSSASQSHRHQQPPMPRSTSEESQFTLAYAQPQPQPRPEDVPDLPDHSLAAFTFPSKLQPRSNPRHSMPASAGYTESTPPSRGVTPSCDEREWEHEAATIPLPLPMPRASPATPPRLAKKSSSRRNKINTPSPPSARQAVDPLARLDTASTMAERASIALSYISNESDMRSSMASSLLHDAKVLKAYTRDLGGVEERDSASETDSSLQHGVVGASASASVSGSGSNSNSEDQHSAYGHGYAPSPHKSHGAPKAKANARSSRRHVTPPRPTYPPHPFASAANRKASESGHETDDEALKALEVAAKETAKRTGRYTSVSEERRASGCQGVFSDAED